MTNSGGTMNKAAIFAGWCRLVPSLPLHTRKHKRSQLTLQLFFGTINHTAPITWVLNLTGGKSKLFLKQP